MKKTLEEAMNVNGYHDEVSDTLWREGVKFGAKFQEQKMISKEAYEDSLNMQRCSNAGYESKIQELTQELENKYSEEEVINIIEQTIEKFYKHFYTLTKSEMKEEWFKQFKK